MTLIESFVKKFKLMHESGLNLKFEGESLIISILNQLEVNKTVFIQFVIFALTYFIAKKLFFDRYGQIQIKRLEGTTLGKLRLDELRAITKEAKEKYDNLIAKEQHVGNEKLRQKQIEIQKNYDERINSVKEELEKNFGIKKEKLDEESKEAMEKTVPLMIEIKDKIVAKLLS